VNPQTLTSLLTPTESKKIGLADVQGRRLFADKPIYDVYGDIVGYITKNEAGDVIRIFAKNIAQITT